MDTGSLKRLVVLVVSAGVIWGSELMGLKLSQEAILGFVGTVIAYLWQSGKRAAAQDAVGFAAPTPQYRVQAEELARRLAEGGILPGNIPNPFTPGKVDAKTGFVTPD